MIRVFHDFNRFVSFARSQGIDEELDELIELDVPSYFREYSDYALLILNYGGKKYVIIFKNKLSIIYPFEVKYDESWLGEIRKFRNAENTLILYHLFEQVVDEFESRLGAIKGSFRTNKNNVNKLNSLEHSIMVLIDHIEAYLRTNLKVVRSKYKYINIKPVEYDFDILFGDARYILERAIVLKKDIINRRRAIELEISQELNLNVAKLTEIMLFLTIIGLVISVPNTVATIFGVSTLAEIAPVGLVINLIVISTIISIIFSLWYLNKQKRYLIK